MNRVRCPACNKWGSKKNPSNLCKKCLAEGKLPKCMVETCNEPVVMRGARYCEEHHFGRNYKAGENYMGKPFGHQNEPYKDKFEMYKDKFDIMN